MTATQAETIAELQRANAALRRERDEREADRDAALAAQAVLAMENARLLGELRERTEALALRNSEFGERIEQQSATIGVLKAMSGAPDDTQPVFDLIARSAAELCEARTGLFEFDGTLIHLRAFHGAEAAEATALTGLYPRPADRTTSVGRAIMERRIVHIRNVASDLELSPTVSAIGGGTVLSLPLLRDGQPIGVIGLNGKQSGGFSDSQIELLKTFAEQAVIAIGSAATYRALRTRTADLRESLEYQTATSDVLKVISRSTFDLRPVLDTVLRTAARLCEADGGIITIREDAGYRVASTYAAIENPDYDAFFQNRLMDSSNRGSLTGRTVLDGRVVHIADLTNDPEYAVPQAISLTKTRTVLGVPLLRGGVVIGTINLGRDRVEPFTDQQIELVSTFADQAVIAIENTRLLTEQQEALEQQTATAEILRVINASPGDLPAVFDVIGAKAIRLCDAAFGAVMLPNGERFRAVALGGVPEPYAEFCRTSPDYGWPTPGSLPARMLDGADVVHIRDVADALAYPVNRPANNALVELGGGRTLLGVALRKDGALLGMITIFRQEVRPFSDRQIKLLQGFADQAVIAMENARLLTEQREALEQQTATAEILRVINASPGDLAPVFETILAKAHALCGAELGALGVWDGQFFRKVARYGYQGLADEALSQPYPRQREHAGFFRGETLHIPDVMDPNLEGWAETSKAYFTSSGLRAWLEVPLWKDGALLGTISGWRREPRPFSDKEIALLESFAAQAVIAMENARLLGELRQRTGDLQQSLEYQTATSEVLKVISQATFDIQPVFDTIVATAARLCEADAANIANRDGDGFRIVAAFSGSSDYGGEIGRVMPVDRRSVSGRAVLTGQVVQVENIAADPDYLITDESRRMRLGTIMSVPLLRDGTVIGTINLGRSGVRPYATAQTELVRTFADQAVIAMENARLLGELRERTEALAERNSAFGERIEHQAATIDVLKAMSASPGDPQPVFDLICRQARTLLNGPNAGLFEYDGEMVHYRADSGTALAADAAAYEAYRAGFPLAPWRGSLTCRAILDGEIIHIRDLAAEPSISEAVRRLGHKSQISVPLMRDGRAIGAISMLSWQTGGFSESQVELLKTFAEQAVIAIGSAETYRALQERTAALAQRNSEFGERIEQQAATIDVLKVMSSTPDDTQPVFDQIVQRATELCNGTGAGLFEFDGELVQFRAFYHHGDVDPAAYANYMATFPMAPTRGSISCRAILDKRMVHIRDTEADPELSNVVRNLLRSMQRSQISIPLMRDGRAIGAISLGGVEPGGFTDSQVALLQTFAEQAVIAITSVANFRALRERTAELARRQDELRVTFENMGDGVAMFDDTQHLVAWNRKFQDMLDVPDDIIAQRQTFAEYIRYLAARGEYGSGAGVEEQVRRLLDSAGQMRVLERVRPNGRVIEVRNNPVAGGGFVLIYADITERKRNEAEIVAARDAAEQASRTIEAAFRELKTAQANLVQAEKMASLGQLTAGIAHEIKNPLNFVNNFAELSVDLLEELKDAIAPAEAALSSGQRDEVDDVVSTLTSNLRKITEHGKRADGIVKAMLEHSRGASGERREVDINVLADEALNLAYHGARAQDPRFNITLERDFGEGIAPIEVNPQEMTRVLLNLFGNGFYAANKRAANGAAAGFDPVLKVSTRDAGDAVEIRVRDNGTGVPDDIRDKLFQPFFTTKPTGEGTGLGLSITYDIVTKAHGGSISVDSAVGEFTEFVVMLPRKVFAGRVVSS